MITAKINTIEVTVEENTTIMEAAKKIDVDIPSLCKHDDLEATAACGICVVKVVGKNQMIRACTTVLTEGMEVLTHHPEVIQVRRTILELILSNHPNECLTCRRNGTCELQKLAEEFGIMEETLPLHVRELPSDDSTKAIVLNPRKCIKCGRCIEICQHMQDVWALSMLERSISIRISPAGEIGLSDSPCIRCGQCSAHCPVGAIHEYDETEEVWNALLDPNKVCIAQIAPAVRVSVGEAFGYPPGINISGQIYNTLRKMGFKAVFDTNFGADVTIMEEASEFASRFKNNPESLPLITTCCPSWVDFMEKFYGDMITYFSSCKSPHAILGVLTKTYYAETTGIDPKDIYMVSIMPCTAKKYEITRADSMYASGTQDVDISITTREFIRMVQQQGIRLNDLNCLDEPDSPLGDYSGAGAIFGTTGGVMEAALRSAYYFITGDDGKQVEFEEIRGMEGIKEMQLTIEGRKVNVAVAHGLANVEQVINRVRDAKAAGEKSPYDFIEVMACPGGCIGGGGQAWNVNTEIRKKRSEGLFKLDSLRDHRLSHRNPAIIKLYADFLGEPLSEKSHQLLHTKYVQRTSYTR
jgi:iron-only hydrogenase group A